MSTSCRAASATGRSRRSPRRASTWRWHDVVDVVARLAADRWASGELERQDVAWRHPADGRDLSAFSRGEGPGAQVRSGRQPCRGPARAGRGHRRAVDQHPQARVAAPEGAARRGGDGAQAHRARPRPRHRVRGRRLPQPVGVLGRRHRDVHGAGRTMHPRLRVLPRRHPAPARPQARRTGARRRGDRPDGPRPRRAHDGGA